jgi:hypothetical protein
VIEWERTGDPASCSPDSKLLTHNNTLPLENDLTATLVAGASRLNATAMRRRKVGLDVTALDQRDDECRGDGKAFETFRK